MKRRIGAQAGFSLLETLLGLTLTAMIGLLMMGSMQIGTRVWERQQEAAQPGEDQLVLAQAAEWLAQAMPATVRSLEEAPFAGTEHRLSFLYAAPGMGKTPGFHVVDLALVEYEPCTNGRSLVLQSTRLTLANEDNRPQPADVERRRLIECLENPSFVFWGAQASDVDVAWRDDWVQQLGLPTVVRLRSFSVDGAEHAVFTQRLMNGGLSTGL